MRRMRRRSDNRFMARTGRALAITTLCVITTVGTYLYWSWSRSLHLGSETYLIRPGDSLRGLAEMLRARGVILEAHSFVLLGYLTNRSRNLKAGEYRFRPGLSADELLDQIVAGRVIEYPVALLEGWTFQQFLQALANAPKLGRTTGLTPDDIMTRLGYRGLHPEGRFYPDTYYYSTGHTDLDILARAFERMRARLEQEWADRDSNVPLKTPDEALTLASIVEKETGREEERRLIAGVFVNRLRRGMRLQSDPTVIYGLGSKYNGNIRIVDLRRDTPYNTYTRRGLPPTPIAMPGGAALAAALNPQTTTALYFVASGDGRHVFSATLKDHNAAVKQYLKNLNARAALHSTVGAPGVKN